MTKNPRRKENSGDLSFLPFKFVVETVSLDTDETIYVMVDKTLKPQSRTQLHAQVRPRRLLSNTTASILYNNYINYYYYPSSCVILWCNNITHLLDV